MSPSQEDFIALPSPDGATPNQQIEAPSGVVIEGQLPTADVRAGASVLADIGQSQITPRAEQIRQSSDEAMVWQESPSPTLLLSRFVKYVVWMAILFALCAGANRYVAANPWTQPVLATYGVKATVSAPARATRKAHGRRPSAAESAPVESAGGEQNSNLVGLGLIFFGLKALIGALLVLRLLFYALRLQTTKYSASSQRLIVESGSWRSVNRTYELHQMGDGVIVKPLLLRLFGVAHLQFERPRLKLLGLRNAAYVRDILRQGGQLEAQRADKARWR